MTSVDGTRQGCPLADDVLVCSAPDLEPPSCSTTLCTAVQHLRHGGRWYTNVEETEDANATSMTGRRQRNPSCTFLSCQHRGSYVAGWTAAASCWIRGSPFVSKEKLEQLVSARSCRSCIHLRPRELAWYVPWSESEGDSRPPPAPTYKFTIHRRIDCGDPDERQPPESAPLSKPVGTIQLRLGVCPDLQYYAGNVGYYVCEEHRGQRIALNALLSVLELARWHNIRPLWVCPGCAF
eukprot:SAG31_NODE_2827_length_5029_cov_2.109533_3_plen_237_part_00